MLIKPAKGKVKMVSDNLEAVARAICEHELRSMPGGVIEAELPALLHRYWQVIAAEISAGLRDEDGLQLAHSAETGLAAWETWLDEHPNFGGQSGVDVVSPTCHR